MDLEDAVVQVFFIRGGRLIGRDHFYLKRAGDESKKEVLSSFIKQFYAGTPQIPPVLMIQEEIEDLELLEEWLTQKKGYKVHIRIPKKGTKEKQLLELLSSKDDFFVKIESIATLTGVDISKGDVEKVYSTLNDVINKIRNGLGEQVGIECFTQSPTDVLMWSYYGQDHKGVCIEFEIEEGVIRNVSFYGGCNGNLKGIAALVEGVALFGVIVCLLTLFV